MKAKITHPDGFKIFVKGETFHYPLNTILEDPLAQKAISARCAQPMIDAKKKSKKNLGGAPENKAS